MGRWEQMNGKTIEYVAQIVYNEGDQPDSKNKSTGIRR